MPSATSSNTIASDLRPLLRGEVIAPTDAAYDTARGLYYTGFDRRPSVIARPADTEDVAATIRYARQHALPLAVKCGGHSVAGHSVIDDALVLDLSRLKGVEIDVEGRTAWAQGGVTAGEYTAAAGAHGLVTGFGDSPSVGIGGITLGGGVGFLHRSLGITIDNVLGAEVVTADGETIIADEASHPDLFWALRGGGGNFGVVTRIRYRLHPVDTIFGGMLILPASPQVIERFVNLQIEAPEGLSGMASVMFAPPMPLIPEASHGKPIIFALLVFSGPAEEGERVLAPFRALATPVVDDLRSIRYAALYEGGEPPRPPRMAVRSFFTDALERGVGETILDHLARSRAPMRVAQFRVLGGAVKRVPAAATAFAHRDRDAMVVTAAAYGNPAEAAEHEAWADAIAGDVRRGPPGAYVGFLDGRGEAGVREAYPEPTWSRLREVKRSYDPDNLFRFNQNVPPAGS